MNSHNIKRHLKRKLDDWIASIVGTREELMNDPGTEKYDFKKEIQDNVMITGGAIVSLLNNEDPNDYDIYFKDVNVCYKVAQHYIQKHVDKTRSCSASLRILPGENSAIPNSYLYEILYHKPKLILNGIKFTKDEIIGLLKDSFIYSEKYNTANILEYIEKIYANDDKKLFTLMGINNKLYLNYNVLKIEDLFPFIEILTDKYFSDESLFDGIRKQINNNILNRKTKLLRYIPKNTSVDELEEDGGLYNAIERGCFNNATPRVYCRVSDGIVHSDNDEKAECTSSLEIPNPETASTDDMIKYLINKDINRKSKPIAVAEKYVPKYFSSNAISISDGIQIILRFTGTAQEIHKNFDFVHCTCVYDYQDNTLSLPSEALQAIMNKELRYMGSRYPLASIIRTRKFISRGYTIRASEYVKMAIQLQDFDLKSPAILADQLCGVDLLYFASFIDQIKQAMSTEDILFDMPHLFNLLDSIFGNDGDYVEYK